MDLQDLDTTDRETPSRAVAGSQTPASDKPAPGGADASRARRQRWTIGVVTTLLVAAYLAILLPWLAQRHAEGWAGLLYHGVTDEDVPVDDAPFAGWFLGSPGQVRAVLPGSPAARAGIEVDDRVVAISGVPVADGDALADLARRLHRGDRVTYELADGRRVEVLLESPLSLPGIGVAMAVSALVGFAFLAISLLVARAKPGSRQALVFYLSSTSLATLFFVVSITELQNQNSRGIQPLEVQGLASLPWIAVYVLVGTVAANLLLHLVLIFPRPRPILARHPRLLVWLHSLTLLPLVTAFAFVLGGMSTRGTVARGAVQVAMGALLLAALLSLRREARRLGSRNAVLARPLASQGAVLAAVVLAASLVRFVPDGVALAVSLLLFFTVFVWHALVAPFLLAVLTVVTLVRSYRDGGVEEKRQLRWPLWGTSVALVGSTVLGLLLFVLSKLMPELYEQTWCAASLIAVIKGLYVLIPLSFAFAIAKYHLMDIDLLLRKTAVYAAMSAFVVAAFLLLVGGLGVALVAWTGVQNQVVTVVATLLLVAVFVPVRNRVQAVVDRRYGSRAPDRDQALATLRREVLTADDLKALLPRLAETVQQTLGSRAVVLFVLPVHGGALEARAKVGVPDEVLGTLRVDAGPLAAAGRVVEREASTLDEDDRTALRRLRLRWLAPARRGGEVVAAVAAGRHLDGSDPDGDELDFLAAVADQLALAVATLGQRREAVELDQARELQRSLLPAALPQPAGAELAALWQPAREVAGDYYDALDFSAEGSALCIGDVVGKGMPAALLMASLQAAVRAVASPSVEPVKLCEQVRRVVCQSLTGGRFVTFFYAFLRPGDGGSGLRLTYTNAGHIPPLLHRAGGTDGGATETGRVERLEAGGGAFVRLLADTPLTGGEVELAPGDRLLLFTDGVSEARSASGEMYGEARVEALLRAAGDLSAGELANRVADDVRRFAAGEPADDLTLLVLRAT